MLLSWVQYHQENQFKVVLLHDEVSLDSGVVPNPGSICLKVRQTDPVVPGTQRWKILIWWLIANHLSPTQFQCVRKCQDSCWCSTSVSTFFFNKDPRFQIRIFRTSRFRRTHLHEITASILTKLFCFPPCVSVVPIWVFYDWLRHSKSVKISTSALFAQKNSTKNA